MAKLSQIFEKLLYWMLLGLAVFIPLYPKLPLLSIKGSFVSVRLEDFFIALILLTWGIYLLISKNINNFFKDRVNQIILLFLFIGALSTFSAIFLTHTVVSYLGILHFLRRVEVILLLPVAVTAIRNVKQLKTILIILSFVVFIVLVYGLGQKYLGFPIISTTTAELSKGQISTFNVWTRINSTFGGQYDLAIFLVMAISIITAMIFYVKNLGLKVWLGGLGVLSFLVLIMTATRFSFVAAIVGVLFVLIISGQKKFVGLAIVVMILALLYPSQLRDRLVSTVTVSLFDSGSRYDSQSAPESARSRFNIPTLYDDSSPAARLEEKVVSTDSASVSTDSANVATKSAKASTDIVPGEPVNLTERGVYRSIAIRLDKEWPRALRALNKNPLLGTGYSSIDLATDNDYLRSLGEIGLLGTFAFILVLIAVIKSVWKNFRSNDKFIKLFSVGILAMIVAVLINAVFIDIFEASKVASMFWLILGVNLAIDKFKG